MRTGQRLAVMAALLAAAAPGARAGKASPRIDAEFQPICRYDVPLCAEYQRFSDKLDARRDAEALSALQKDFAVMIEKAQGLVIRSVVPYEEKDAVLFEPAAHLRRRLASACLNIVPLRLSEISDALADQERRLAELEKPVEKYGKYLPDSTRQELLGRLQAVDVDSTRLWKHLQTASLDLDHVGAPFIDSMPVDQFQSARNLTAQANPLAARIAELSRRLQTLDRRLGGGRAPPEKAFPAGAPEARRKIDAVLHDPFGGKDSPGDSRAAGVDARLIKAPSKPAPADTLMGMRHLPAVAAPTQDVEHFRTGTISDNADRRELLTVTLMQRVGLTKTVGDPARRAHYAFKQTGGTCAIASQVQVLEEAGLVAHTWKARKQKETELYEKAVAKGMFIGAVKEEPHRRETGGVPPAYAGDLLGIPIQKHYRAKDEDLEKVVSKGKMVIVRVDAGVLRNNPDFLNGWHAIVVTGAERSRLSGKILGYYINDTSTGSGGRFVAIEQFHAAWRKAGSTFVEPL